VAETPGAALRSPSCCPPREPRVLLVDDEANIRKMVGRPLLESEGFETAEAANGSAGVADSGARWRLMRCLLDLMMAGGPDGLATLEQLSG